MKLIFTKNKYKTKDNQPNFLAYLRDPNGDIYQGTYKKKDGSDGLGWAPVGALWASNKNGEQYLSVDLDMNKIKMLTGNRGASIPNPQPTQPIDNTDIEVGYDANGDMQVVQPGDDSVPF